VSMWRPGAESDETSSGSTPRDYFVARESVVN
jgi:hypothetical protein